MFASAKRFLLAVMGFTLLLGGSAQAGILYTISGSGSLPSTQYSIDAGTEAILADLGFGRIIGLNLRPANRWLSDLDGDFFQLCLLDRSLGSSGSGWNEAANSQVRFDITAESMMALSGCEQDTVCAAGKAFSDPQAVANRFASDLAARREARFDPACEPTLSESSPVGRRVPEPATLTIWGVGALALAAATYRRRKRGPLNNVRIQAAVESFLGTHTGNEAFRHLGSYLATLADDPAWTSQEIEAFYDEVVVSIHNRQERAHVA